MADSSVVNTVQQNAEPTLPEGGSLVDAADDIAAAELPQDERIKEAEEGDSETAAQSQGQQQPPSAPQPAPAEAVPAAEGAPVDPATAPAPDTLSGPIKELWAKGGIAPEVKAEILKRESDFRKGYAEIQPRAEIGDGYVKALQPYLEVMKQYGVSPIAHTENLLKYHSILMFGPDNLKGEILLGLAKDANIDLRKLAEGQVAPVAGQDMVLQKELARMRGTLTSVTSRFAAEDAKVIEKQISEMAANAKDYPYFMELAPAMLEELRVNPKLPIDVAYRTALAANRPLYDQVMDARAREHAQRELTAAKERAAKARTAKGVALESSSAVRPASRASSIKADDLDAMLADSLDHIKSLSS